MTTEGSAAQKQVKSDVCKYYRFKLKNNREMRLSPFIDPLLVQEDLMIIDYWFNMLCLFFTKKRFVLCDVIKIFVY